MTYESNGRTWGALRKAWKGYRLAKVQGNQENMVKYAKKIRELQTQLNVPLAIFPNLPGLDQE